MYEPGTMFAPMQGVYENEPKGMESPNMETLVRCKKRTGKDGTANYCVRSSSA